MLTRFVCLRLTAFRSQLKVSSYLFRQAARHPSLHLLVVIELVVPPEVDEAAAVAVLLAQVAVKTALGARPAQVGHAVRVSVSPGAQIANVALPSRAAALAAVRSELPVCVAISRRAD